VRPEDHQDEENRHPTEESSTNKAVVLDLNEIPVYHPNDEEKHVFNGKRIGPGQQHYRTKGGRQICADINVTYNNLRKRRSLMYDRVASYIAYPGRAVIPV
jgi:hypothetical protein